ncbi:NAD(P)/FAD-dependent oxidoreductase [Natronosalvus halobius]|uniref:NAD(P)/FAD-dependent oxidoreductase n=1 Tax=Natronosalvus halobius TaxID=2953746 RepID=UPI0020A1437A|nr:FAD-binding oxidoreductase [Natronosalvus halobius]USZ73677.1 FAD-binding oxidoreductase [Natronosalvus halobius]
MRVGIIGGGIIGLYTAHFLLQREVDVTIFEKSTPGSGSTGRSGGGIRSQFSTPVNVELSTTSRPHWDAFEDEFETDIRRRRVGYLFLARDEPTARQLEKDVKMQNEYGVPSEYLEPNEAAAHCPGLYVSAFTGASYSPQDEFVDPHLVTMALVDQVESSGVTIERHTEVTDVHIGCSTGIGVQTENGTSSFDTVVNTAGPWAGRVTAMADLSLPIKPELHRLAYVLPETALPETVPLTIDLDGGAVFRPEGEEGVSVGGHTGSHPRCDPDSFPQEASLDWIEAALEGVAAISDRFGPETELVNTMTGLYATTPDSNPIIEETCPGFVNVIGFSGHGFMHAPAVGQVVTELIMDGEASSVDISSLTSDRFDDTSAIDEQSVI